MRISRGHSRLSRWRAAAVALAAAFPPATTLAQGGTCNGFISLQYPVFSGPTPAFQRVRLTLSTGTISGGAKLTVTQIAFYFDCRNKGCSGNLFANCNVNGDCPSGQTCVTLGTTCIDDGNIVAYAGDLTTTCPTTWSQTVQANRVLFGASPPLEIPAQSAGCSIEFTVQKLASFSNDTTPLTIEQVAAFTNARCDNDLASSSAQSGLLSVLQEVQPPRPVPAVSAAALAVTMLALFAWAFVHLRRLHLERRRASFDAGRGSGARS